MDLNERPQYERMLVNYCPECKSADTAETTVSVNNEDGVDGCLCNGCGHFERKFPETLTSSRLKRAVQSAPGNAQVALCVNDYPYAPLSGEIVYEAPDEPGGIPTLLLKLNRNSDLAHQLAKDTAASVIVSSQEPARCPYCGGKDITTHMVEWRAVSQEDRHNVNMLNEHQCNDCGGKSFWT